MPAGHRGPRPRRALLALAAVGCAALFGAGSPAHAGGGATTTLAERRRPQPRPRDADRGRCRRRRRSRSASSWRIRTRPRRTRTPSSSTTRRARTTATTSIRTRSTAVRRAGSDLPGRPQSWLQARPRLAVTAVEERHHVRARQRQRRAGRGRVDTPLNTYTSATAGLLREHAGRTVRLARDLRRARAEQLQQAAPPRVWAPARRRPRRSRRAATSRRHGPPQHPDLGRSTTRLRRTWGTARRWRSSAGASPIR